MSANSENRTFGNSSVFAVFSVIIFNYYFFFKSNQKDSFVSQNGNIPMAETNCLMAISRTCDICNNTREA